MEARRWETVWGAGKGRALYLPCQGLPPASAHEKQELVKGELERRERKQTESEKSLELEVLGSFGLAEPPPGPLLAALQADSDNPRHMCV